ncbi:signal-induced proliferation-associated 1-like protein 1 isoform X2 [Plutella xylostella]|uniref:signal-induced proliferation-associated 1-like protein 1 isoform X2 n=1 Tax=Plutella xylostella TaxID=51655 RepID=UPI0020323D2A|nr:signal-induced proliferation-associated 1-like protein 1 isoform X2 [Plutella xylostella]
MFAQEQLRRKEARDVMYRSNSSLDLIYLEHGAGGALRREYGSHGSIDVIGGAGMGQGYGDKAAGLARLGEALDAADGPARAGASPKPRLKLNKLWGGAAPPARTLPDDTAPLPEPEGSKRRQFAHYDCQSLLANLSYAAESRGALLSRRRNTTTGASAASLLAARGAPPGDEPLPDLGDGRCNELLESCPFFRNELGGEEERCVSLCYRTARGGVARAAGGWHRPQAAYGLSVLEFPPGQSHWRRGCPYTRSMNPLPVESQDVGALYYRNYFYNQPHQNWFGLDEQLGPVAISVKKERVELRRGGADATQPATVLAWQYRLIIRTSELLTLRGSILEDALTSKPGNSTTYSVKELLEYQAPELQAACLRLGVSNNGAEEQLLRLDEQCLTRHYKVGVMYCRAGQSTEEEMYNNQEAGPAFVEFLQTLGQTVRLKDFDKYKAGLDNRTDSTGLYSVYTTYQGCEVMFHVSTMLPYTPNNRQQLLRKRHIGNDIVTIVFQEPGSLPFTPRNIRSQFQHVFVVVRAIDPCSENTHYSIAVSRAKEVPLFGPPIKDGAVYPKGEAFTDLLLAKVINGENAAIQSPKFSAMATRTRQEYLKELARSHVTATALDTHQKFSIFSSLLPNRGGSAPAARPDSVASDVLVGGALCFHVQVQDEGAGGALVDCVAGLSTDTLVLVDAATRQLALVVPTDALLGWVESGPWTRIYYHLGESVRVRGAGLRARLRAVAPPAARPLPEITLRRERNQQLGFHVKPDGLVTAVEGGGCAARSGIRRGARLLEVCRAAVIALQHDQLVDLLKCSDPVTVTVTFASPPPCLCDAARDAPARPSRADAQLPRRSPPSDSEGYGTGSSGRSARSPQSDAVRRRSQESPRHARARRDNTTSLTEELMRLMDAELGDPRPNSTTSSGSAANITAPSSANMTSTNSTNMTANSAANMSSPGSGTNSGPPSVANSSGAVSAANSAVNGVANKAASPRACALPLPDATQLDWSALVHTATRAMLQICEEHQFPSLDNHPSNARVCYL